LHKAWRESVKKRGTRFVANVVKAFATYLRGKYGVAPSIVGVVKAAAKAAARDEADDVNEEAAEKAREVKSDDSEMECVATDDPDVVAFRSTRAPVKRSIEIIERDHPEFYRYVLGLSPLKSTKRIKVVFYPNEDEMTGEEKEKKEVQDAVEERVGGSKTVDDGEIGDH
jgi:hypothetical protein